MNVVAKVASGICNPLPLLSLCPVTAPKKTRALLAESHLGARDSRHETARTPSVRARRAGGIRSGHQNPAGDSGRDCEERSRKNARRGCRFGLLERRCCRGGGSKRARIAAKRKILSSAGRREGDRTENKGAGYRCGGDG